MRVAILALTALAFGTAYIGPAEAATCRNTGNFDKWVADFKKEALAQGISPSVLAAASPYLQFEQRIVNRDRAQGVFNQSFLKFSDRMIAGYRMQNGQQQIKSHAALFAKVEKEFGVPAPILTAFWGLESDFGKNTGKSNVFAAITTLAYDCRRPDYFRPQLFDALRIVQRGDLTIDEMQGGDWAGELGAMQFTASDYYKYAVDYDGDGRRNLVKSTPDTIASAANFLKNLGWKRGEPWLEEVRLTRDLPWDQADLAIQHPRSQWTAWGVRSAHGTLPADGVKASLLLPDGPPRTSVSGLRQFPGIARLELLHGLRHDRGLFRNPARGGAADQPGRSRHRGSAAGAGHGTAASADYSRVTTSARSMARSAPRRVWLSRKRS